MIRQPQYAGSFYSDNARELTTQMKHYIENAEPLKSFGEIKAIVSPHAGYEYSGQTAAFAYKLISGKHYEDILLLGPSHRVPFTGLAIGEYTHWDTPLGSVDISPRVKELTLDPSFSIINDAHLHEHSLEVQVPFLQHSLESFKLFPIVTGTLPTENAVQDAMEVIDVIYRPQDLLVISTDLSHFLEYTKARYIDGVSINKILDLNGSLRPEMACGSAGIKIAIALAQKYSWKVALLDYRNSGDTAGDKSRVVGYASMVFYTD